jgi:cell division transport system permease protein
MTAIKNTWHHLRRSPFQSLIALFVMIFSFFVVSFFIIINSGLSRVLTYFETKPEITIFLKDGLDQTAVNNLQKELSSYPNIKEIKFISKDKALEIYKQENKDNPMLTEMVTASILPASFEVTVSDPATLEKIYQNYATRTDIVDEIIYQKDIISSLLDWTNAIRKTGLIITIIVGLIGFFTISTIIGMKITNRKDEIKISRLLGASNFYVKKPFLLEGVFYGVFGSFVGSILSFILAIVFRSSINSFFQPVIFIDTNFNFYGLVLLSEIFFGSFIGLLASWIGVKRYIKF